MDAQTRPPVLAKPRRRGFARAPTASIVFVIRNRNGTIRREKSRFLRFYVASDILRLRADELPDFIALDTLRADVADALIVEGRARRADVHQ
jgi:hypothetical protein